MRPSRWSPASPTAPTSHAASARRILASLDHPGIARLLDGGTTDDGLPYFALEYVEGMPLTEYVTSHALDLRARLALFRRVCDAVAFAHGRLVVHRDLKPGNILVNVEGTPKLLDFGIAKVVAADGEAEAAPATVTAHGWMTPAYASPEQVRGEPTTTVSDVYALGLILYELLTETAAIPRGSSPIEVAKRKLDGTIAKPSTAVLRAEGAAAGNAADRSRRARLLRGDLDTIVLKAVALEPERRYESVAALADEIDRYLTGLPIRARGDSVGYRAGKFVKRNRWTVTITALAATALLAVAAVAVRQAQLAELRFEQVRDLARSLMFDLHDAVAPLTDSLEARRLIVDRSLIYLDALAADDRVSEEVRLDVVRGYLRLASILGGDLGSRGLGQTGEALARTLQAVAVAREAVAARPTSAAARVALAGALETAADAHDLRGDVAAAVTAGEEAIAIAEALHAEFPEEKAYTVRLASASRKTAVAVFYGPSQARGLSLFRRAVELERALLRDAPNDPARQLGMSAASHFLGVALGEAGDFTAGETHLREALRIDEQRYAHAPDEAREDVADDLLQLAQILTRVKRHGEATPLLQRVVALRREVAAAQPRSNIAALRVGSALDRLALAMFMGGQPREAVAPGREALAILSRVWEADRENAAAAREYFFAMVDLSAALQDAGGRSEGCDLADRAAAFGEARAERLGQNGDAQLRRVRGLAEACRTSK